MANTSYHREPIVVTQAMWDFVISRLIDLERLAGIEPRTVDIISGQISPVTPAAPLVPTEEAKPKRGTRLPKDWLPDAEVVEKMRGSYPHITRQEWITTHESFLDHWASQPGARGVKLDWNATWRNWVRREFNAAHYRARARVGTAPSTVDQKVADLQSMKD